jgi:hypothetical protein
MHFVNACTTASWSSSQPAAYWFYARHQSTETRGETRLRAWRHGRQSSEFPFDASTPLLQSRPSFSPPRLVPGEACRSSLNSMNCFWSRALAVVSLDCCYSPCFSPSDTDNTTSIGVVEAVLAVPSCLSPATARAMRSFELLFTQPISIANLGAACESTPASWHSPCFDCETKNPSIAS